MRQLQNALRVEYDSLRTPVRQQRLFHGERYQWVVGIASGKEEISPAEIAFNLSQSIDDLDLIQDIVVIDEHGQEKRLPE